MNEKLNLAEILKDCPEGTKLYSPVYGDVELMKVIQVEDEILSSIEDDIYPIKIKLNNNSIDNFTKDGRMFEDYNGECMLFPSKEQRDWTKFRFKKPKFDPMTFKPYDKVLVRDGNLGNWKNLFFSYIIERETCYPYLCLNNQYKYCIPYNEDTKHLVGTSEEAPEFYRYWEE